MSDELQRDSYAVTLNFTNGYFTLDNSLIVGMYYIEDIFASFVTGKLTFVDNFGLLEYGPMTGNETILIQYTGVGEGKTSCVKQFQILKISEVSPASIGESKNSQIIELHFMDPFFSIFNLRQFSRSWPKDTEGHVIIKDIITKMAKVDEKYINTDSWEECNEKLESYYIPWWNCSTSIKWLMKRLSGKKSNNSGYLFFTNSQFSDKRTTEEQLFTLNFVTLDSLLSSKEVLKLDDSDNGVYTLAGEDLNSYEYNIIQSYTLNMVDKQAIKGIAGGRYYGYNNKDKTLLDIPFTYNDHLKKHTILGESSLFDDISDLSMSRYFTGEQDQKFIENIAYDDWIKRYVMQNYVTIVVPGHEKRYAGALIEVKFPSDNTHGYMEQLSGGYLIKTITHYWSPTEVVKYKQKLVLIKNGYDKESELLVPAEKKNLIIGSERLGK